MSMKNKTFNSLVTGGAGFIGSHLADALIKEGHNVFIIDLLSTGFKKNVNKKATFYKGDINDSKLLKKIFKNKIDFVFHCAAQPRIQPSIKDPKQSHYHNVEGTLNILIASRNYKVKKFIYSASSSVYGDQLHSTLNEFMVPKPKNPYALYKLIGEKYCKLFSDLYGLRTVCLRYFNVYGQRQSEKGAYATVIGIFLRLAKAKKPLTIVGDGKQTRDFTHVEDIVRANILAIKTGKVGNGDILNIGSGKNYSINQLADLIGGEKVYIDARPGEVKDTLALNKIAGRLLGWYPQKNLEKELKKLKHGTNSRTKTTRTTRARTKK